MEPTIDQQEISNSMKTTAIPSDDSLKLGFFNSSKNMVNRKLNFPNCFFKIVENFQFD